MPKLVSTADVARLLHRLLPISWMYLLARIHGRLVYHLSTSKRLAVTGNLAEFAENAAELKVMTRRFFELRQTRVMMLVLFLDMKPNEWDRHYEIEGLEHLDTALSEGNGAVFLGSHLNSIGVFMAVMILKRKGYEVSVPVPSKADHFPPTVLGNLVRRRDRRPTLNQLMGAFYAQFNVRPIVQRLAKNEVIGQTGDGLHSVAFTAVPFLGRTLPFTTGMLSVAQSTGAMVVPFNVVGKPPDLRCSISAPYRVPRDEDAPAELTRAVAGYASALEKALRENILCWEHWLIPNTLDAMAGWPERSLQERNAV